jgi:hypothetical protein
MSRTRRCLHLLCPPAFALAVVAALVTVPAGRTATAPPSGDDGSDRALVAADVVAPTVRRVPLTVGGPKAGARFRAAAPAGEGTVQAVSGAEPVQGYGTVGVTWDGDQLPDEDAVRVEVRTSVGGSWSPWQELKYHPEHGPDPDSREGRAAKVRAGTEPVVVGDVDRVQVRATTDAVALQGLALEVVDPGEGATRLAEPALDLGAAPSGPSGPSAPDGMTLARATPPKPKIFSRSQWGADWRLRDPDSLSYGRVRVGFVHHTVNANGYSRSEVPQIIRGIYAYHTRSRGWSDIGYNFLVDRFGRMWEGRYGGVTRAVVGAHTYGYNSRSFAMAAIGNFETTRPGSSLVMAYGTFMGWKLAKHGVDATKKWTWVKPHEYFRPVSAHRDAGATACPGRYLYAELPDIRGRSAWLQKKHRSR